MALNWKVNWQNSLHIMVHGFAYLWMRGMTKVTRLQEVYDGEFTRTLKRIRDFVKLQGSCVLGISLIVDQTNAEHVYYIVQLLLETGVHNDKISLCVVSKDGTENNLYHQPNYSSVRSQIDRLLDESSNSDFELFDAYHELETKFAKDYEWCPFLQALCNHWGTQCLFLPEQGLHRQRHAWFTKRTKIFRILE